MRVLDWKTARDADTDYLDQLRAYAYLLLRRYPTAKRVYAVVAWIRHGQWDPIYFERDELEEWWSRLIKHLDPLIPVLMVTAAHYSAAAEALVHGALAYIPKPFTSHYINHLVASALATQPARR